MNENDPYPTTPPEPETNATFVPPPDEQARLAATAGSVTVPGFAIDSTLGHGAFGVVYKAKQAGLNRVVALKMLIAGPYASPATLRHGSYWKRSRSPHWSTRTSSGCSRSARAAGTPISRWSSSPTARSRTA